MLNEIITKIENNVKTAVENDIQLNTKPTIKLDFQKNKLANLGSVIIGDIKLLQKKLSQLPTDENTLKAKSQVLQLSKSFEKENKTELLKQLSELKTTISQTVMKREKELELNIPNLPAEIKSEIEADIQEIKKCHNAGCYRSAVVLCGRLLETSLHRKYYEATGQDILEKNPGIGLGNLIAKLMEKGVELDPGLSQQIHLVNQVRIFSVHKKQRTFYPTKAQTNAIILFTIDVLEKLF
ncbi:MAG: DUF4145 domain-containing protein [archaeon]